MSLSEVGLDLTAVSERQRKKMNDQEECYIALVSGSTLINEDGLKVFLYDGALVNESLDSEDISFLDHCRWQIEEEV